MVSTSEMWRLLIANLVQKMMRNKSIYQLMLIAILLTPVSELVAESVDTSSLITQFNWRNHHRIKKVREIYDKIQGMIDKKEIKVQKKDFTGLSRDCRGTYPLEYLELGVDAEGLVRIYTFAQRISHDDLETTKYYYSKEGVLRFVFVTVKSEELSDVSYRVYFDDSEKIIWDVKQEGKKLVYGEVSKDPTNVRMVTASRAIVEFREVEVKCNK